MANKVLIKQFRNKAKEPVAGLTPEHAVYDANGVRLDAKLGSWNLSSIRDAQTQSVKAVNEAQQNAISDIEKHKEDLVVKDEAIQKWLDVHPEATTTVQDGAITPSKMNEEFWNDARIKSDYVTPQMFGAKGDGVVDDTKAFMEAIKNSNNVYVPKGVYLIHCPQQIGGLVDYGKHEITEDGIVINKSNFTMILDDKAYLVAHGLPQNEVGNRIRAIVCIAGDGYYDGEERRIENITIKGGHFVGGRSEFILENNRPYNDTKENYSGFTIIHANNVIVKDCYINDQLGDAILTMACDNVVVDNVYFARNRRSSISPGSGNGFLINNCKFEDDVKYHKYSNGNYSYSCNPQASISPEADTYTSYTSQHVERVIVQNCNFDVGNAGYLNIGKALHYIFRNNYVYNISKYRYLFQIKDNTNERVRELLIENNTLVAVDNIEESSSDVFALVTFCDYFQASGNKSYGIKLFETDDKSKTCIVCNNYINHTSSFNIKSNSIEDNIVLCKDNITTANIIAGLQESTGQHTIIKLINNIAEGSHKKLPSRSQSPVIGHLDSFKEVYIIGNHIVNMASDRLIIKSKTNNAPLILKNNYIFMGRDTGAIYLFNIEPSYINADIIYNTFHTKSNVQVPRPEGFEYKMNVVGNTLGGTLQKLSLEDVSNEHLTTTGNVKL